MIQNKVLSSQEKLFTLLDSDIPALKQIQRVLDEVNSGTVGALLKQEPTFAHILNYYFDLFDSTIGARIINSPDLPVVSLKYLFDAQMGRYYTSSQAGNYEYSHRFFMESYWRYLGEERLMYLFKSLLKDDDSSIVSAVMLLPKINPGSMDLLSRRQIVSLLETFSKKEDSFRFLIQINPDIFDTLYRLARELGETDNPYIDFLDAHAAYTVQLRISQLYLSEAEKHLDEEGRLPFKELVRLLKRIPGDAIELTLEMLVVRQYVHPATFQGIQELRNFRPNTFD